MIVIAFVTLKLRNILIILKSAVIICFNRRKFSKISFGDEKQYYFEYFDKKIFIEKNNKIDKYYFSYYLFYN